jgi:glycerate-2-kinase
VISDVAPFGAEVVGSGPFIGLPHRILADNHKLVRAARVLARGERIFEARHSILGNEAQWARKLTSKVRAAIKKERAGLFIWGGEPQVDLRSRRHGRGGRQCQIAARLALEFWDEIRLGRIEILCGSSDGCDGNSGAAAVYLRALPSAKKMKKMSVSLLRQLKKAIASYNTAPFLNRHGFLISGFSSGTNVQDLILIRVNKPMAS